MYGRMYLHALVSVHHHPRLAPTANAHHQEPSALTLSPSVPSSFHILTPPPSTRRLCAFLESASLVRFQLHSSLRVGAGLGRPLICCPHQFCLDLFSAQHFAFIFINKVGLAPSDPVPSRLASPRLASSRPVSCNSSLGRFIASLLSRFPLTLCSRAIRASHPLTIHCPACQVLALARPADTTSCSPRFNQSDSLHHPRRFPVRSIRIASHLLRTHPSERTSPPSPRSVLPPMVRTIA